MGSYGHSLVQGPVRECFKCGLIHTDREIGYICHFRENIDCLRANVNRLSCKKTDVIDRIAAAERNNERPLKEVEMWLKEVDKVVAEAAKINGKAARIRSCFSGWIPCSRFSAGRDSKKMIPIIQGLLDQGGAFGNRVAERIPAQDMTPVHRVAVETPVENLAQSTNSIRGKLGSGRAVQIFMSAPWENANALGSRVSGGKSVPSLLPESTNVIEDEVSDGIDIQNLPSAGDEILSRDLKCNGRFMAFSSRLTTAKQIIRALQPDSAISLLGVYGMPGIGKSTLVLAVADHLKNQKIFDEVVVVELSSESDVKSIQDDIAKQLDLKFEADKDIRSRKNSLLRRLDQGNKQILIVLENLWDKVELAGIGIPYNCENCKVLFTTRIRNVCNSMDAWNPIEVKLLLDEESMKLFRDKAGPIVDSYEFGIVARVLVKECQGLPLALVTLGRVLRDKKWAIWDDTRRKLWNSRLAALDVVHSCIEISYDHIQSIEQKLCFLFSCMFPAGYHISTDQLLHYMIGEGLLSHPRSLEDARGSLQVIVDELISSSLFLNTESGCIEMQNVIRIVAITIASKKADHGFIVGEMQDPPDVEFDKCKRLSFATTKGRGIQWRFPLQIKSAQLLTLSFHGNENLHQIPADLFKELPSLMTLDLSYSGIKEIPQSLEFLVELRALLLEGCHLEDVELSNKLKRLKLFSLRYSKTKRFSVLGEIRTLKLLDLSYTSMLQSITSDVVSSFPELEELYLSESLYEWGAEGTEAEGHASFSEVISLTHLTSLELRFGMLNQCRSSSIPIWGRLLERFKIVVGMVDMVKDLSSLGMGDDMLLKRRMFVELDSNAHSVADWIIVLMERTYLLHLKGCGSLDDLMQQGPCPQVIFSELHVLILSSCLNAISLIPCDLLVIFRRLNKLVIDSYESMVKLIEFNVEDKKNVMGASSSSSLPRVSFSNLPPSSVFPNLACLRISKCAKLKYLFPMRVIRALLQLEMLYISDCISMERVIEHESCEDDGNADKDTRILPRLKRLKLENLPGLLLFVRKDIHVIWPSLEELTVKTCLHLEKLPLGPHSVPKLKTLAVDSDNWFVNMQWDDEVVKHRLELLLNILILSECESLMELHALWPLRTLSMHDYRGVSLIPCDLLAPNLENVKVNKSQSLEMLIDFGGGGSLSSSITVTKLSKSTPFLAFGNLRCLEIFSCEKLKHLLPMRVVRVLSQLKKLHVRDCPHMEMLIVHETAEDDGGADKDMGALPKLVYLTLEKLPELSSFVRQDILFDFPSLEDLIVNGCLGLKKLPLGPDSALKLKSIQAFPDNWFGSLEWDDQGVKARLQSFVKVKRE